MPIRQRLKENVSRRTADEKTVKHGNIWRRLHGMWNVHWHTSR